LSSCISRKYPDIKRSAVRSSGTANGWFLAELTDAVNFFDIVVKCAAVSVLKFYQKAAASLRKPGFPGDGP
jgi:hypothetical protein